MNDMAHRHAELAESVAEPTRGCALSMKLSRLPILLQVVDRIPTASPQTLAAIGQEDG
jgi:hypothetical protein